LEVLALLKDKARKVLTIASNQTVDDAICLMAAGNVSALVVTENDRPTGIFSEGDVYESVLKNKSAAFSEISIEDAMTPNLLFAEPQDPITIVLDKMMAADIAHLSVIEDNKIVGMLTIMDLMEHQIASLTDEINQLEDYIADLHDAGQD
jgi:CBS domain-containing protein